MDQNHGIYIQRQTAAKTQIIGRREIYIVVKQSNFLIEVASKEIDLEGCEIRCVLLYDTYDKREVSFVNSPPIRFKIQTVKLKSVVLECKISVLSSKHEDMLFIVKIEVSNEDKSIATLFSQPIKVTSKLESKKKPKFSTYNVDNSSKSIKKQGDSDEKDDEQSYQKEMKENNGDDEIFTQMMEYMETNTALIEQIKSICVRQNESFGFENEFKRFIQSMQYVDYANHYQYLMNIFEHLNRDHLYALEEIMSIHDTFKSSTQHSAVTNQLNPLFPYQMNPQEYQNYYYSSQLQQNQQPSQPQFTPIQENQNDK